MSLPLKRYPRYHEPWGQCATCGEDKPISRLKRHKRWGFQCTGPGGCWDGAVDREMQVAARRFPPHEGVRRTPAPLTNTVQEGVDGDVEAGDD